MKLSVKWIVAAVFAYLVFLIYRIPAAQVIHRVSLPANIAISGVSGTLWNGKASMLVIDGLPVEQVNWQLSFLSLLVGNANLDIKAGNPRAAEQISLSGPISINLLDSTQFETSQLTVFAPAFLMFSELPLPIPVDADGRIKVTINELQYQDQCVALSGQGQWLNAKVAGLNQPVSLGNFSADLACQNGTLSLTINPPNKLGLTATANIAADFQISVEGQFKPDADLPKEVSDAALFFGAPDPQGFYQISF